MKSKERNQNSRSRSKQKKKPREIDSYKIQFKTKIKNNKSNQNSKDKDKKINKSIKYTYSNISAKTYNNQKPTSSIIKEYNTQSQINSNNAISYSNYAFPLMENSKKNENNELNESSKYNNEDYNTFLQSINNSNNKLDINDLNNTINKKISTRQNDNNMNHNINNDVDVQNNYFSKRAAYSVINENQKKLGNYSYNISNNDNNRNMYETSLKRLDDKLNNKLDPKNFKIIKFENMEQNLKYGNELEQYINSNPKINIKENNKIENYQLNNYTISTYNNKEYQKINNNNNYQAIEEQNNTNHYYNNNNKNNRKILLNNNEETNPNGQDIKLNFKYNQNLKQETDNLIEINSNIELYNELEEKLQHLYLKIHGNNEEAQSEIPECINNSQNFQNQMIYPSLKRYRQKSEPSLRVNPIDSDLNSNVLRRKKSEKNINTIPHNLIVKFPKSENENKNLSELRILEENLKNENSSKRMLNILLKQQNNPELQNILSELQTTIKKLPRNEDSKEDNSISTLPANHLFPFDIYKFEKTNIKRNNKFKPYNYNIREINNNRKIEKFKSKFNEYQEIINKKPKSKNTFNVEPKEKKENNLFYYNNKKNYTNLCPANNIGKDLFYLEN